MSQTETHIGKLRKVVINEGYTIEDWCREKCQDHGVSEISSYNDTWLEEFREHFYEKYFVVGDEIWEAFEHKELDGDDIYEMVPNSNGTISFTMQFYNGGTCLSECIEEGLEKLKNEGKI